MIEKMPDIDKDQPGSDLDNKEPETMIVNEREEPDCPVCGGSGPCGSCERGRNQTEKWKAKMKGKKKSWMSKL